MKYILMSLLLVLSIGCKETIKGFNYETASPEIISQVVRTKIEYYGSYNKDFSEDDYVLQNNRYYEKPSTYNFKIGEVLPYWCYLNNPNFKLKYFLFLQASFKDSIRSESVEKYKTKCDIRKSLKKIIVNHNISRDKTLLKISTRKYTKASALMKIILT